MSVTKGKGLQRLTVIALAFVMIFASTIRFIFIPPLKPIFGLGCFLFRSITNYKAPYLKMR